MLALALAAIFGCDRERAERHGEGVAAPERAADPVGTAVATILASATKDDADDTDGLVTALAALGEPAIAPLARALDAEPQETVRLVAVEALAKALATGARPAADALLGGLDDPSEEVRLRVVQKLGELRERTAVQPLLALYRRDEDAQVRYECLTSLGLIGDPAAAEPLVAETRSDDPYVRMWAMDALCQMRDERAPSLAASLLNDPSPYVREQVVRSCARAFDTPEGHRALVDFALSSPEFQASVAARATLAGYVRAGSAGTADAIRGEALAALSGPRSLRAALLLGDLGDKAGTDRLIEALGDPDYWVRHHAAFLLARIGEPRAVPALIRALEDHVELVAMTAYSSLRAFAEGGDKRAAKALEGYKGRRPTGQVRHGSGTPAPGHP